MRTNNVSYLDGSFDILFTPCDTLMAFGVNGKRRPFRKIVGFAQVDPDQFVNVVDGADDAIRKLQS